MSEADATLKGKKIKSSPKGSSKRWSVTGVSAKTRRAVIEAARNDGVRVGKWVDGILYAAATSPERGRSPTDGNSTMPSLATNFEQFAKRLTELATTQRGEIAKSVSGQMRSAATAVREAVVQPYVDGIKEQTEATVDQVKSVAESAVEQVKGMAAATFGGVAGTNNEGPPAKKPKHHRGKKRKSRKPAQKA